MKKFFIIVAALCLIAPATANATRYNALFDCGNGVTVWIALGPYGHGPKTGEAKMLFEVTISNYDFEKGPARSPEILFKRDVEKDINEVTADGHLCRSRSKFSVPVCRDRPGGRSARTLR
jgi:hypothetical protein